MTNSAYTAAVRELEQVLPPRVVSRSLKDGLTLLGKTSENVTVADISQLLRGTILRQLQAIMPHDRAQETIEGMLERIANPPAAPETTSETGTRGNTLTELTDALRPFNMYFEWPEVQKLRAQVQLIETEMRAGEDTTRLVQDAREQLTTVRHKLEDQLVLQAGELTELEEAAERLSTLGGPRVRRLGNLLEQIREAQAARQLAPAEIERARILTTDLRKLLESSVYSTVVPRDVDSDTDIDALLTSQDLPEDVSIRILQLDLESEAHRLEQLKVQHTHLLTLRPELAGRLQNLLARIASGNSVRPELAALELGLTAAFHEQRNTLGSELGAMAADAGALATPIGQQQLKHALQVTNGILATTLPDPADINHLRDLYQLAREQEAMMRRTVHDHGNVGDAERLASIMVDGRQGLINELYQLEQESRSLAGAQVKEYDDLVSSLHAARSMLGAEDGEAPDIDELWVQLEDLRSMVLGRLDGFPERIASASSRLSRVERLNTEDVFRVRHIIRHLSAHQDRLDQLSLNMKTSLERSLAEAEEILDRLESEYEATRDIAGQLASTNVLDDLLGGLFGPAGDEPEEAAGEPEGAEPEPPAPAAPAGTELERQLGGLAEERGVSDLRLVGPDGDPATTRGLADVERDLQELSGQLGTGAHRLMTLELAGRTLVVAWPTGTHRLVMTVESASLSLVLHRLRNELGTFARLLG